MRSSRETLAIVAVSARALAEAARRCGDFRNTRIVALDWFADQDLLEAADYAERLPTRRAGGFAERPLLNALRRLVPDGSMLVAGSGFESRLPLLARLSANYRFAGNPPAVLARVKDPAQFFPALTRLGIPHPQIAQEVPQGEKTHWLIKRIGGAGGRHIRRGSRSGIVPVGRYAQRRIAGRPVSLAFLADGSTAEPVGFTEQWPSPVSHVPFRFGGAAYPSELPSELKARMADWAERLAREFGLRGLNSADFLVDEARAWLLEVNPRPGATLDLLDCARPGLFQAHIDACFGRLRLPRLQSCSARGALIVYGDRGAMPIGAVDWPVWVADRPHAGSTIPARGPICTVFGEGRDAAEARRSAELRAAEVLERLDAAAYAGA
jgi:predicted ATP-grasp superfamily ATP-dependent carboligase